MLVISGIISVLSMLGSVLSFSNGNAVDFISFFAYGFVLITLIYSWKIVGRFTK